MENSTLVLKASEKLNMVNLVPNSWNNFQNAAKKAEMVGELKDIWSKMSGDEKKKFAAPEKEPKIKTNGTCCTKMFSKLVKDCKLH